VCNIFRNKPFYKVRQAFKKWWKFKWAHFEKSILKNRLSNRFFHPHYFTAIRQACSLSLSLHLDSKILHNVLRMKFFCFKGFLNRVMRMEINRSDTRHCIILSTHEASKQKLQPIATFAPRWPRILLWKKLLHGLQKLRSQRNSYFVKKNSKKSA
jgi:hypothetical protein